MLSYIHRIFVTFSAYLKTLWTTVSELTRSKSAFSKVFKRDLGVSVVMGETWGIFLSFMLPRAHSLLSVMDIVFIIGIISFTLADEKIHEYFDKLYTGVLQSKDCHNFTKMTRGIRSRLSTTMIIVCLMVSYVKPANLPWDSRWLILLSCILIISLLYITTRELVKLWKVVRTIEDPSP
jgi:hypothetical protein